LQLHDLSNFLKKRTKHDCVWQETLLIPVWASIYQADSWHCSNATTGKEKKKPNMCR